MLMCYYGSSHITGCNEVKSHYFHIHLNSFPQGLFKVYQLPSDPKEPSGKLRYLNKKYESKPAECIIRVYVVRGVELQPKDPNGKADPYLVLEIGKKKISDKDNYIPNTLNPYFGKFFKYKH